MDPKLAKMFSKSRFTISSESYYYCSVSKYPEDLSRHFMVTDDKDEITVVTQYPDELVSVKEKLDVKFLLVKLFLDTPFMKGTLFNVSKAVYESDSNILIVSTYSKDLLLIKAGDKEKVEVALTNLGVEQT